MDIDSAMAAAAEKLGETSSTPAPEVVETTTTEAPATETTTPADAAPSPAAPARVRDEHGRFTPKPGDKPAQKAAEAQQAGANGAAAAATPAAEAKPGAVASPSATAPGEAVAPKPADPAIRPPQSWKPEEREEWAKVPPKIQAAVLRREREIQAKLNETDGARKSADEFHRTVAPYQAMLSAQGVTPTQAVDALLRTQYVLQSGPPQQKAQILAQVIQQFGVPIDLLDAALSGQAPQGHQQPAVDPAAIAQQAEQRILQRLQQQASQAAAQRSGAMLAKFAEARPFFEDVRGKMADILAARGVTSPTEQDLGEVYDLACNLDPEISRILKQREAAKAAPTAQAATARTLAAASSVKSTPAAAHKAQPKGIDAAIRAAAEKLGM